MNNLPEGYTPINRRMIEEPKPKIIRRYEHYRPVGVLVVLCFLVLGFLLDHNVPVPFAVLLTMLAALIIIMFS